MEGLGVTKEVEGIEAKAGFATRVGKEVRFVGYEIDHLGGVLQQKLGGKMLFEAAALLDLRIGKVVTEFAVGHRIASLQACDRFQCHLPFIRIV